MKIYYRQGNRLDVRGVRDSHTIQLPNGDSFRIDNQSAHDVLTAKSFIPDPDHDDACRFRMLCYVSMHPDSLEAEMMDSLTQAYRDRGDETGAEQVDILIGMLDAVRAKFGERP